MWSQKNKEQIYFSPDSSQESIKKFLWWLGFAVHKLLLQYNFMYRNFLKKLLAKRDIIISKENNIDAKVFA